MKIQFTKYCLVIVTLFILNSSYAQTDMLFWFVAPEINDSHWPSNPLVNRGQPTWLRFSNTENFQIMVTVLQPAAQGFTPISLTIPANETRSIQFVRGGGVGVYDLNNIENYLNSWNPLSPAVPGNKGFKGLKIESTGRMTCYYEMAGPYNMDLMSLKGRNALGTEFYVPFQTRYDPPASSGTYPLLYSAIDIVATENNTLVTIEPTEDILLILNTQQSHTGSYSITLNAGETFSAVPYGVGNNNPWNIDRNKELAGTHVTSNKPIAVNTKDDLVADGTGAVDMVADQLVPINLLGMKYVIMEGRVTNNNGINSYDNIYVIPIHDNTDIDVDDNGSIDYTIINAGDQLRIPINNPNTVIAASDTILVYHVTGINPNLIPGGPTSNYNQLGGAIIPTIDVCTGSYRVSFVRSYTSDFILNVMVRDGGQDGFDPAYFVDTDFTEIVPGEWWTATKSFTTGEILPGNVTVLENFDNHLFHLAILHGSVDCFYGYFSDFNSINVIGNVGTTINTDYFACYGESVELVAYGANTYYWYANLLPSFLSGQETLQRPVINPTDDRKYTVVGYGDCGMKDSVDINVYVADPVVSDFVIENLEWPPCAPIEVAIADFSDGSDYRYKWWFGDGAGDTLYVATDIIPDTVYHTYRNTSDTIQIRKISLITENTFFCKDTLETDVIVYPEMDAAFDTDTTMGCNPLAVRFTDLSTGNTDTYRWIFGDGSIVNTVGDVNHTYNHLNSTDTMVYDVELRLTSPFLCRDTARTTISVFSYLEGEFTIDEDEGCSPLIVIFTNNSAGEDSLFLDYGDGTQFKDTTFTTLIKTYTNTGDTVARFPVELRSVNDEGCEEIWRDTIIVYPEIEARYTIDDPGSGSYIGCNTRTVLFTNPTPQGADIASTFLWTFGDGTTSNTTAVPVSHLYTNNTADDFTYAFRLRAETKYGCWDDTTNNITIYRADANFIVDDDEGCSVLPVNITNTSIGSSVPIAGWEWDYDDGVVIAAQQPGVHLHNYTNNSNPGVTQNRNLSLTVTRNASCSDVLSVPIIVHPALDVSFTPNLVSDLCDSGSVSFDASLTTPVAGTAYSWDFGDGTSSVNEDPSHIFRNINNTAIRIYKTLVTATSPDECFDTMSVYITVHPQIKAFFALDESSGCSPDTVLLTPTSYPGISQYNWDFGDLSPLVAIPLPTPQQHVFPSNTDNTSADDIYTIRLTTSNTNAACDKVFTRTDTVFAEAKAIIDPSAAIDCNELNLELSNNSINAVQNVWDFDDGSSYSTSTITPFYHNFVNTDLTQKDFDVSLNVTSDNGCEHDTSATISVQPFINADFNVDVIDGCSPLTVSITNLSTAPVGTSYSWIFTNAVPGASAVANPGSVVFSNSTGATITEQITLLLTGPGACTSIKTINIDVYSSIDVSYANNPISLTVCDSVPISFNAALAIPVAGTSYLWSFGDGTASSTSSTTKIYRNLSSAGAINYRALVKATTTDGCWDTISKAVRVRPYVNAKFAVDKISGCTPLSVAPEASSYIGISQYSWDFGDGTLPVTGLSPISHIYPANPAPGPSDAYQLKLLVSEVDGVCKDSLETTITVYAAAKADFSPQGSFGCNPDTVNFINNSLNSTSYFWDFGNGITSTLTTPTTKLFSNSSILNQAYSVKLRATSGEGCIHDTLSTITVYPYVKADFNVDVIEGCSPLTVNVSNLSTGPVGTTYSWVFDNGVPATSNAASPPIVVFTNNSGSTVTRQIQLSITGSGGCISVKTMDINVFSEIAVDYTSLTDPLIVCDSSNIVFTPSLNPTSLEATTTYSWDFGDGVSSSSLGSLAQTHLYRNLNNNTSVIYPARVLAETSEGCISQISKNVTVRPYVKSIFTINNIAGCSPTFAVDAAAVSLPGISQYSWDFGDSFTTTGQDPASHTYPKNITGSDVPYVISLEVLDPSGECNSISTKDVSSYSENKADFSPQNDTLCNPRSVSFQNLSSANSTSFIWDFGDGTTSNLFTPVPKTFTNTTDAVSSYSVNLLAETDRGCTHDTTVNINLHRRVKANFDLDEVESCSPFVVSITNNSTGGIYRWYWNSVNGSGLEDFTSTSSGVTFTHEYINNSGVVETVYLTCIAENAAGCTDTLTKTIAVQSEMKAQFVSLSGTENCTPFTVNFDNLTDPASDAQSFTRNFDDGTSGASTTVSPGISHIFVNGTDADITRTVRLTAKSSYGCSHDTTLDITIYRRVIASFELNTTKDCSPVEVEITNKSKGGVYDWSWHDAPISVDLSTTDATLSPILHTYTNTSQADVIQNLTVVAGNGHAACNETYKKAVTIHSSVMADFSISDSANCTPLSSSFSPVISADAASFYWYYSDATANITTAAFPLSTHVFTNPGINDKTFRIKMVAETQNACVDSITKEVVVYSYLDANMAMESSSGCPPFTDAVIKNTSIGNNSNTYQWFVDGNPIPEFTSTGLAEFIRTYDNSDPSVRDYSVRLLATNPNACTSEETGIISVYERVIANFDMDQVNGCTPLPISFSNTSQKTVDSKYLWNFGDGSTSGDFEPAHPFVNTSRETDKPFTIKLKVTSENYCTDDTSVSIEVYHNPLAKFFIDQTSSCPPLVSGLDKSESLGEDIWEWRFGDGSAVNSIDTIFDHTYTSSGTGVVNNYDLVLWVATNDGCKDSTESLTVNVYPSVNADFDFTALSYCSPTEVQFTNNSSAWVNNYYWRFDDGNTTNLQNPKNRYDITGITDKTYKVYLRVSSEYNCWDTITKPVVLYIQPNAEFNLDNHLLKFPKNIVGIDNLTNMGPFDYNWEFGDLDESTSTVEEPGSFEYEHWGEKIIELTVASQTNSDCNDYYSDTVLILTPDVNADFTTNIDGGCLNDGLEVRFEAQESPYASLGDGYIYEWDFGDGNTAGEQIVYHTYEVEGIYNVQLTVKSTDPEIGEDYEYEIIQVHPNPEANFEVAPKLAMLDVSSLEARVKFFNLSICNDTAGCSYVWDFGDGNTANSAEVTHNYDELGRYDISLLVISANACRDSLIRNEEVEIIGAGQIAFPNAFTPNGDNLNDSFKPVSEGVIEYEMLVYNRWGELIFTTKDLSAGWDGTINGQDAKPDVYVWKAQGKFTNGKSFELAGDVTVIR